MIRFDVGVSPEDGKEEFNRSTQSSQQQRPKRQKVSAGLPIGCQYPQHTLEGSLQPSVLMNKVDIEMLLNTSHTYVLRMLLNTLSKNSLCRIQKQS